MKSWPGTQSLTAWGASSSRFMRGDPERPYYWGFSQPQWISLSLIAAVVWAELAGTISLHPWHLGVTAFLVATMIAISLRDSRKEITRRKLLHPRHLHEFAGAIQLASDLAVERVRVKCKQTPRYSGYPRGMHLSRNSGFGEQDQASDRLYPSLRVSALRKRNYVGRGCRTFDKAFPFLQMKHPFDSSKLIKGGKNVFHFLVHTPTNSAALISVVDELRDGIEDRSPSSLLYRRPEETPQGMRGVNGRLPRAGWL